MSPIIYLSGGAGSFFVWIRPYPEGMPSLQRFACHAAAFAEAKRLIGEPLDWALVDEAAQSQQTCREIFSSRYDRQREQHR